MKKIFLFILKNLFLFEISSEDGDIEVSLWRLNKKCFEYKVSLHSEKFKVAYINIIYFIRSEKGLAKIYSENWIKNSITGEFSGDSLPMLLLESRKPTPGSKPISDTQSFWLASLRTSPNSLKYKGKFLSSDWNRSLFYFPIFLIKFIRFQCIILFIYIILSLISYYIYSSLI